MKNVYCIPAAHDTGRRVIRVMRSRRVTYLVVCKEYDERTRTLVRCVLSEEARKLLLEALT